VRLLAVGPFESQQYEKSIMALTESLGIAPLIEWTGFTHNVAAELERMDLFVLPSLFGEGLPMVVLEAMAAGVPVVGTEIEGVPEAIRHGIDGVIAKPNDVDGLASMIERVFAGHFDWQALRSSALARHAALFSDRSMATGVAEVYRSIL
jgi:glycosyltransferase involved in cell wall biosynthesis